MSHRLIATALLLFLFVACRQTETRTTQTPAPAQPTATAQDDGASVPLGQRATQEQLERERFGSAWRQLPSFAEQQAAQPAQPALADVPIVNDPKFAEKLAGADPATFQNAPFRVPIKGDVSGPSVLKTQILLDRARFSPGAIDGRWGKNSEIAVYWFQRESGLPATGEVDEKTIRAIAGRAGAAPPLVSYTLTDKDLEGPFKEIPDDVYEQEKLDCLCYETVLEKLAEKFHVTQDLLKLLNPSTDFAALSAGTSLLAPNVRPIIPESAPKEVTKVIVSVEGMYLHGMDANGKMVFHAPTTVGSEYDPSPSEELKLVSTHHNPWFKYQPKLFAEVPDDKPEANLHPGPNSPVGVVWMALSKKHFGIHGTSDPETIGYSASHGCVRLTNWDAHDLSHITPKDSVVDFTDTRKR